MDISPAFFRSRDGVAIVPFIVYKEKLDDYFKVKINKNIKYCQKMEHCFTFIVYNDAHYHIPSVIIFSDGKISKHTKMTYVSVLGIDLGKGIYNQRERTS